MSDSSSDRFERCELSQTAKAVKIKLNIDDLHQLVDGTKVYIDGYKISYTGLKCVLLTQYQFDNIKNNI
jgi:hypothetical protein